MSASKRGLGRGLDALLPEAEERTEVSLDDIQPRPDQPRQQFSEEELRQLAASIRQHGLLQPLVVAQTESGYTLIAGERRLRAAKLAGLTHAPVVIRTGDEQDHFELALVENIQRADLNPAEEARAYARLQSETGLTHAEIADRVGKSRSRVTNFLRLLDLPDIMLRALERGELTPGHANALLALPLGSRAALFEAILRDKLTVRESESWKSSRKTAAGPAPAPSWIRDLEGTLSAKVERKGTDQRGRLVVHYHSREELDALIERLTD